ncbi:MAG TPA: hypothetical protein VGX23_14805 [Actinocrinis sp.]|nr:hypothetical protein [Actinocrinis sp.]
MRAAMGARLTAGTVGVAMLGFGAWHLITGSDLGHKQSIGKWLLGGVIVHDGIIAPVVFGGCALAWRLAGARLRRGLAVFLLAGGSVTIVALPSALRSGDNSNPTVTPLDYPRNLALVLGGLAVCVLLYVLGGRLNDRRHAARAAAPVPDAAESAEAPAPTGDSPEPAGSPDTDESPDPDGSAAPDEAEAAADADADADIDASAADHDEDPDGQG